MERRVHEPAEKNGSTKRGSRSTTASKDPPVSNQPFSCQTCCQLTTAILPSILPHFPPSFPTSLHPSTLSSYIPHFSPSFHTSLHPSSLSLTTVTFLYKWKECQWFPSWLTGSIIKSKERCKESIIILCVWGGGMGGGGRETATRWRLTLIINTTRNH